MDAANQDAANNNDQDAANNNSKRFLKNLENCERVVVLVKSEIKNTEIGVHLTSEYKLYSGMNLRTISSSSFKSRSVLFLLQPPF